MAFGKRMVLRNTDDASGGGGLDMTSAVNEIGSGLGLDLEEEHDDQRSTGDLGADEPAATPAPPAPPAPSPAPASAATAPVPGPAAPAPAPAPDTSAAPAPGPIRFTADAAPSTWTHAAASQWAELPLSIREEIARRENNMFSGLEQYKGDAGVGRQVKAILAPVIPNLEQMRIPPQQFLSSLVQAHQALANPKSSIQDRTALVKQMAKGYGIDLDTPQQPVGIEPYTDPEVQSLRETVAALESRLNESAAAEQSQVVQQRSKEIDDFAADPKNPYFYDVADEIAMLVKASGGKMSLQDAYKQAVRLNPVTFARETERLQAEAVAKANKEAADRAAAARKASGTRVRTSGHQGGGTADSGSMEDTMQATLDSIRSRERQS